MPPSHAGGVVFWDKGATILYLLVRPLNGKAEWVLPKGHVENAEDVQVGALREVREETGIIAEVKCSLPDIAFSVKGNTVRVRFFLMKRVSQVESRESREIGWFSYPDALIALTHAESKEVLQKAEKHRLIQTTTSQ